MQPGSVAGMLIYVLGHIEEQAHWHRRPFHTLSKLPCTSRTTSPDGLPNSTPHTIAQDVPVVQDRCCNRPHLQWPLHGLRAGQPPLLGHQPRFARADTYVTQDHPFPRVIIGYFGVVLTLMLVLLWCKNGARDARLYSGQSLVLETATSRARRFSRSHVCTLWTMYLHHHLAYSCM